MKKIVCYITDDNYLPYTVVSIVSLLRHNDNILVCVFNTGLTVQNLDLLRSSVSHFGGDLLLFDVSSRVLSLSKKYKGYGLYKGLASFLPYVKLYIADYLPGNSSRVLYLDGDTLVNGSLDYLFNGFYMGDKPIALASDCMPFSYRRFIKMPFDRPYYNGGVMLLDLARFRSSQFKRRFFECLSIVGSMPLAEQDVINRFLFDDIALLPPQFNYLTHYTLFDYPGVCFVSRSVPFSQVDFLCAKRSPVVYHFLGNYLARPWFRASKNPLRSLYCYSARVAGVPPKFVNLPGGFPFVYRVQWLLWRHLPQWAFNFVASLMFRFYVFLRYRV